MTEADGTASARPRVAGPVRRADPPPGARNLVVHREQYSTPWLADAIWAAAKKTGHGAEFKDDAFPIEDDHLDRREEVIVTFLVAFGTDDRPKANRRRDQKV